MFATLAETPELPEAFSAFLLNVGMPLAGGALIGLIFASRGFRMLIFLSALLSAAFVLVTGGTKVQRKLFGAEDGDEQSVPYDWLTDFSQWVIDQANQNPEASASLVVGFCLGVSIQMVRR